MRIGELAEISGNTTETIRYYEKVGLLPPPVRGENNYRNYGSIHVNRLDFIRHCRNLDIGLSEIRDLLEALDSGSREGAALAHELIRRHLLLVDERIRDLNELRGHLKALETHCRGEACDGRSCGILRGLEDGWFDCEPGCGADHAAAPERAARSPEEFLRSLKGRDGAKAPKALKS